MARVALVTGGTRGIGAAISKALKDAGYGVAANYAGNDAAAEKFKSETGIPVYKWDVSSFDACAAGVKQVEADLGPVDVLVNNAGIGTHTPLLGSDVELVGSTRIGAERRAVLADELVGNAGQPRIAVGPLRDPAIARTDALARAALLRHSSHSPAASINAAAARASRGSAGIQVCVLRPEGRSCRGCGRGPGSAPAAVLPPRRN